MQSNEKIILKAIQGKWLYSLAFFYKGKNLHVNSCFYNYSLRSVAKKLGCSPGKVKKHLDILKREGMVRFHGKNLIFRRKFDYTDNVQHKCTLKIDTDDTLKTIANKLRIKLIEYYARHQQKKIDEKAEARFLHGRAATKHYKFSKKEYKRLEKTRHLLEMPIVNKITFSDKTLAKRLKCSGGKVTEIKRMLQHKVEKPKKLFLISHKAFQSAFAELRQRFGTIFWSNGYLMKPAVTEFSFNPKVGMIASI